MPTTSGTRYFLNGFSLITTKGLKRFVFIPFAINLLMFSIAFYFLIGVISEGVGYILSWLPEFLNWLEYLLWAFAIVTMLLIFALVFGTIANWIAAPFNGLLSEKVERYLTGQPMGDDGISAIIKDIPRTLGREAAKLIYFIPRALIFLVLFFALPVVGQILWFLFTAWMMAIQYCDYPFDNHKIGFRPMRLELSQRRGKCFSFGITVNVFSLVPIVNFLVMPAAICGATQMWVEQIKPDINLTNQR